MLRSTQEILGIRKEFLKSAKKFRIKYKYRSLLFNICTILPFALLIILLKYFNANLFEIIFTMFIVTSIPMFLLHIHLRRLKAKWHSAAVIAGTLKEILEILEKPGGENVINFKLEQILKSKKKEKSSKFYQLVNAFDSDFIYVDDAPMHAYMWVASQEGPDK
jgi:hypothetical protein